ncbi:glycosyl transferase family 2 [Flavobacterium sediminis]|uniref:Glycosyl transferase family 2 n=1 Tax=Flavobacterium sediminis TaxID=2201181 RepID=A0A2U8QWK9_9FLAO|nr:glycosyltransferase family 2 protein [Flavobacterium sediminis]AWM14421.1 glycosyl transferase family 2 [Flavobacterium sediminis]
MQLSVVILNYNVRYFLEQCVGSVQKALQDIDGEIIVVDNASSDDSRQMIKEQFPDVILIENKENLGFPKGNNIGVARAKGDYICILNPDTVVVEDTFSKLLTFVTSSGVEQSHLGITGCKLIDGSGKFLPESKRGVPTPWVAFTKIFGFYKLFPKSSWFNQYYAMHLNENQSGEVDVLVGAFMLMQRELYLQVGGFDENCFMYSDDIDLSYLVKKAGRQNYYFAGTTVIHYKGESTVRDGLYMKRFREAMQFFYKKHFKKSWFFDSMMQIGSFAFSLLKVFQSKTVSDKKPEHYVLVSDDVENETVLRKINAKLKTEIYKEGSDSPAHSRVELIIDLKSISFKKAIRLMEEKRNKDSTFKFLSINHDYLIGSNNSNDRGEVILL